MEGWICLYRKILENPIICKDSDYFAVWCYLLLSATHKDMNVIFGGDKIILREGQLITGRKVIAEKFKISESKVKRILIDLENDQQIDRQRSNKNSLVTIINWNKYQSVDQQNDQQVTNKWPASDQQVTTNNNVNNINNITMKQDIEKKNIKRKVFQKPTVEEINQYCTERENKVDPQRFFDFYESKGWKVGKEPMKDWKACVRTWEKNTSIKQPIQRNTGNVFFDILREEGKMK